MFHITYIYVSLYTYIFCLIIKLIVDPSKSVKLSHKLIKKIIILYIFPSSQNEHSRRGNQFCVMDSIKDCTQNIGIFNIS